MRAPCSSQRRQEPSRVEAVGDPVVVDAPHRWLRPDAPPEYGWSARRGWPARECCEWWLDAEAIRQCRRLDTEETGGRDLGGHLPPLLASDDEHGLERVAIDAYVTPSDESHSRSWPFINRAGAGLGAGASLSFPARRSPRALPPVTHPRPRPLVPLLPRATPILLSFSLFRFLSIPSTNHVCHS